MSADVGSPSAGDEFADAVGLPVWLKRLMSEANAGSVEYRVRNGVAWIRLCRPEQLNALSFEMYRDLFLAFARADCDDEVDAVVVTGTGVAFSAGGDLKARVWSDRPGDRLSNYVMAQAAHNVFCQAESMDKLVIAAVNGPALAGGLILTLTADIAVASDRATFAVPETRVGLSEPYVPARLVPRVGFGRAQDLIQSGRTLTAGDALEIGLVAKVVDHDDLENDVCRLIDTIRSGSPYQRARYKEYAVRQLPPFQVRDVRRAIRHPDASEGTTAFREKRPPVWSRPSNVATAPGLVGNAAPRTVEEP